MGASSWNYIEAWADSVEGTFTALRAREFARVFSGFPAEDRPADLAELWSGDDLDETTWAGFMRTQGTHTIVDIQDLVPSESGLDAPPARSTMRHVPVAEVVTVFGHRRPGRAEFERLPEDSPLFQDDGRATGRCLTLYDAGAPTAVAFWGCSGD